MNCIEYGRIYRLAVRASVVTVAVLLLCAGSVYPQMPPLPEIFSSPLPTGSGARAVGSGGAFLAIADDATAASWNPAGLVHLERPELSVVLSNITYAEDPQDDGRSRWSTDYDINYLSAAYPFQLFQRNMVVSLNYQQEYDFTKKFKYHQAGTLSNAGYEVQYTEKIEFDRTGGISSITPAYAVQITPRFSLGAAVDIYVNERFGHDTYRQKTVSTGSGQIFMPNVQEPYDLAYSVSRTINAYDFSATAMTVGALYDITNRCSLGLRLDIPFSAESKVHDDRDIRQTITVGGTDPIETSTQSSIDRDHRYHFPTTWAVGLAYKFSDALTVMTDLTRVEQDQFEVKQEGDEWIHPATGDDPDDVDPTHTLRLGAEYLFIKEEIIYPVRCGVFYDQEPADGHPNDYWGFAVGSGIGTDKYQIDIAYQLRLGDDVDISGVDDRTFDTQEHLFAVSAILYF